MTMMMMMMNECIVAVGGCGKRRAASSDVLHANRLRRRVCWDVWSQLRAPVRSGERPSDHYQCHDQTRLPTGLGVRAHQDLFSG